MHAKTKKYIPSLSNAAGIPQDEKEAFIAAIEDFVVQTTTIKTNRIATTHMAPSKDDSEGFIYLARRVMTAHERAAIVEASLQHCHEMNSTKLGESKSKSNRITVNFYGFFAKGMIGSTIPCVDQTRVETYAKKQFASDCFTCENSSDVATRL
jgi:alpha-D-ribose 1-methylphosphonate 5-triphosphate synthase subunit PhnG